MMIGAVGCGDEPVQLAEFAEVCGVEGPVRVLPLEPTERLWGAPQRVGDRYYYTVRPFEGKYVRPALEQASVWSSGLCGESPVRVAEGMILVDGIERWPDVVLGCDDSTGRVFRLDPGGGAPKLVFDTGSCQFKLSEQGVFSERLHDERSAELRFHRYPEEPGVGEVETVVVLDPIQRGFVVSSEGAYATTTSGALMRFDLDDRSLSTVRTGVLRFAVSPDGRYALMQGLVEDDNLDYVTPRPSYLLDRQTGITTSLGESSSSPWPGSLEYAEQGFLLFGEYKDERVYFLPDLRFVDVPDGYRSLKHPLLPDGRWIIEDVFSNGGWL